MRQDEARNLSMVMDFYEMTMANSYFGHGLANSKVAFDVFYRRNPDKGGFAIFAGLEQIIDYIQNIHFTEEDIVYLRNNGITNEGFLDYLRNFEFKGDIYSMPEGTIMYPNTPIMTIVAPLIDAQLIETEILLQINHQSLVATKARRVVKAAQGRGVSDFGARRAHNNDAAVYGSRAAFIGGVNSTATVLAGQMFDIPVSGTMAHSYIMYFESEFEAFKHYALSYPDACTLLVDTYDVLRSGIPNAIRVAKEVLEPMGKRLKGIRLDSGDLAYLSKKSRKMLNDAGLEDCKIVVSNSLDEFTIASLISQGAEIDLFGVGERLITAKSEPVFGAVYKIAAVEKNGEMVPRIKISENSEKITNPGLKGLYRVYNKEGFAIADLITMANETVDFSTPYRYVDPLKPWKKDKFEDCTIKNLHEKIFDNGKLVYDRKTLKEIRDYVDYQLNNEIWQEEQRFANPHIHYVDMSPSLWALKENLLYNKKEIE